MISTELRAAIIEAYDGICQYCERPAQDPHIDHIEPVARGGTDRLGNLILACASCNQRKSAGLMSARYMALISAVADKNASRIAGILGRKDPNANWYWVDWRNVAGDQYLVRVNDPPQMDDYERIHAACNDWIARCNDVITRRKLEWAVRALLDRA